MATAGPCSPGRFGGSPAWCMHISYRYKQQSPQLRSQRADTELMLERSRVGPGVGGLFALDVCVVCCCASLAMATVASLQETAAVLFGRGGALLLAASR